MATTAEQYGFGARAPYAQPRASEYDMKERVRLSGLFPRVRNEPLSALDPALAAQTLGTLRQEATSRGAVLVCSLHQIELALAHFPRIIGLRNGRVAFDLPREAVSDAVVDALYRNADAPAPQERTTVPVAQSTIAGCF